MKYCMCVSQQRQKGERERREKENKNLGSFVDLKRGRKNRKKIIMETLK
jgi:hypothetical protein